MEKKYIIDKDNKSFCLAPWMSTHVWPDGKTFPCCIWDIKKPVGNVNKNSLKEIWNSPDMKEARLKMLKGETVSACDRCDQSERTGYDSYRKHFNEDHGDKMHYIQKTKEDGSYDEMNLHLWDLRLSNFCNFKCRSCGFGLSSSWHSDQNALAVNPRMEAIGSGYFGNNIADKALLAVNGKTDFLHMMEDHYKCVDEVYFAGGEPLLMPEHYQILDKLLELGRTDVQIRYSTNFSRFKFGKKHVFDYWRHFKNLQVWISVDGIGKVGEYVRHGFNDKNFENQIRIFAESGIKPPDTGYMITYGVMNFLHLFDMVISFIERDYVDYEKPFQGNRLMYFSPISFPTYLDSRYLPNWVKIKFLERLKIFPDELRATGAKEWFIKDILNKLNVIYSRSLEYEFSHKEMNEMIITTEELDKLRTENFNEVFPYFDNLNDLAQNDPNNKPPIFHDYDLSKVH